MKWKRTLDEMPTPHQTLLGCNIIVGYGEIYDLFVYDPAQGFNYNGCNIWNNIPPFYWTEVSLPDSFSDDYNTYDSNWDKTIG